MVHDYESEDFTQLNSHCDPTAYDPQAKCSFNDTQISLPFSFHHENALVGKGQVVDMAKLVNWAEKKMKKELGDADGKVVYDYNLDPKQTKTANDHEIDMVAAELASMPLIRVDVADNGQLPAEAVRAVDAYEQVSEKKTIKERKLDLAANRIVAAGYEPDSWMAGAANFL
jgi:urease accessory protein UreF